MQIQFDGEITDVPVLEQELKSKGYEILSIKTSRWIGQDQNGKAIDRGGRIDIEFSNDHLLEGKKPILAALEIEIATNLKIIKPVKIEPSLQE